MRKAVLLLVLALAGVAATASRGPTPGPAPVLASGEDRRVSPESLMRQWFGVHRVSGVMYAAQAAPHEPGA